MSGDALPPQASLNAAGSLRWLRLALVAFSLAVMAIHGNDAYRHIVLERETILNDAAGRAQALAVGLDEHLARTVQAADLVLEAAVERIAARLSREIHDADLSSITHTLQNLHARAPQLLILQFIDASGTITSASTGPETLGLDVSARHFFRIHADQPSTKIAFSPPFAGRMTGRVYVPLSRRVEHHDGTFAGVLVAGLATEYLESFYTRLLGADPVILSVFSQEGMLLARIPRRAGVTGRDMSKAPIFEAITRAPVGVLRLGADSFGPNRTVAYRHAAPLPYVVSAMVDEDLLLAGWRDQAMAAVQRAALVFVALLALTAFLVIATYRMQRLAVELGASDERARRQASLLEDAIEAMPEGFVLYDAEDRLVTCNSKFRELRTANPLSCVPGTRFEDIFRRAVLRGEVEIPEGHDTEAWIQARLAARRNPAGHHRLSYSHGRWLRVSERRMRDGGIVAVHADITALKRAEAEIEAARQQMADWAEASNDWFWESDSDHRLRFMSDRNRPAGSNTASLGKRVRDLATDTESEHGKWVGHLAQLERREPFRDFVFHVEGRHGEARVLSASGKPVFDANGSFTGYRGTARDVTDEVTAKENAARAQARLVEALEATEEGFAIWDSDDRLVLCNTPFRKQHGVLADLYQPGVRFEDIVREAVTRGHVPNARGREEELIAERLAAHRQSKGSFESRLANGRWKRVKEYKMGDGGVVGVHMDITDQKMREFALSELARRNALFFTAISRATSAMVIADARLDGQPIIYANPAFTGMTGYGDDETVGQGLDFIYDAAETPDIVQAIREAIAARQPIEARVPARHRDGRRLYLDLRVGPVADRDGEVTHFIVVQDDVTKRVEAEAQRAELETQLRHSQKIEALGTLAGGIAHNVNNTLVPIVALSKMALKQLPPDSGEHESMQTILEAAYRIRDLVAEILAFSRKDMASLGPVALQGTVAKALRLLSATLPPNVVIAQELAQPTVTVSADENQLVQVLMNFCTNAAHAIGATPGRITIGLDEVELRESAGAQAGGLPAGLYARLTVADTGCGMDARTLRRIFEPFYTTKNVGEGTGLGLSMAHGIIANHHGRIAVDSEVGRGTTFTILLPIAGDASDEAGARQLEVA